jgi:hypothetical protein
MASPVHKRGHAVLAFVKGSGCTPGVKGWDLLRIAVTALAAVAAGTIHAAEPPRPNLFVFLADDLGANDLGCTGSTFYRTPVIDGLATGGMTFLRGYAACPVCSPTRAALITGRHPARVGITKLPAIAAARCCRQSICMRCLSWR